MSECLQGASAVVNEIQGGKSVVVASKSVDRTTEVLALSQIMLDPYYRTIEGFSVLIEKEWFVYFNLQ